MNSHYKTKSKMVRETTLVFFDGTVLQNNLKVAISVNISPYF